MNYEQGFAHHRGVTLLELLIAVAIAAILLGAIVPNVSMIIAKSKVTAEVNLMSSIIQYTRFQAIDKHLPTLLCPSHDFKTCDVTNWQLPKIMFADINGNQFRDENEPLMHASEPIQTGLIMLGPKKTIRFFEDGAMGSTASVIICPAQSLENAAYQSLNRALFVSLQGRVRLSDDTNSDGIHERGSGTPLTCS
ncbi:GspH/FimT family pseudopilin [Ningiella sp. W23]|uniref:GspH/FimT family pseudopilin n=1 Tax=Ningiella sp. W23 TaxID=3023715 RepID=UPI0037569800